MTKRIDITKPDNAGDTVINLKISGNYLVRVCNTISQLTHETVKAEPARAEWYAEINEIVERIRDQLSKQRTTRREQEIAEESGDILVEITKGRRVRRKQLSDLFDLVKDPTNWKKPISATVYLTSDQKDMLAEAITFFTGSVARIEWKGNLSDGRCRWHVYAKGYYADIGA